MPGQASPCHSAPEEQNNRLESRAHANCRLGVCLCTPVPDGATPPLEQHPGITPLWITLTSAPAHWVMGMPVPLGPQGGQSPNSPATFQVWLEPHLSLSCIWPLPPSQSCQTVPAPWKELLCHSGALARPIGSGGRGQQACPSCCVAAKTQCPWAGSPPTASRSCLPLHPRLLVHLGLSGRPITQPKWTRGQHACCKHSRRPGLQPTGLLLSGQHKGTL